jgi:hypothetical protein
MFLPGSVLNFGGQHAPDYPSFRAGAASPSRSSGEGLFIGRCYPYLNPSALYIFIGRIEVPNVDEEL